MKSNRPAIITINARGLDLAEKISRDTGAEIYAPARYAGHEVKKYTESVKEITARLFKKKRPLVMVMAAGIAVRSLQGLPADKKTDPPVVVTDTSGRNVISLLSGHEGGANLLAYKVSNAIGAEPVITTGTEAAKVYTLGIGCRKNASAEDVTGAIHAAVQKAKISLDDIRVAASVSHKAGEAGLITALENPGIPLRFFSPEKIRRVEHLFSETAAKKHLNVGAVAEPCAVLAAGMGKLVLPLNKTNQVTTAIAKDA